MRVKICGITNADDALLAQGHGASAIGLIFAEGSRRRVSLDVAREVMAATGPFLTRVGVFRDQPLEYVLRTAAELRLEAVQLHGSEDPAFVAEAARHVQVIKALGFEAGMQPSDLEAWPADFILLDAPVPGSGVTFDWDTARNLAGYPSLILAGGLRPGNVAEAIRIFRPAGVDVASGVEASAGRKSPSLVRSFMAATLVPKQVSTGTDAY